MVQVFAPDAFAGFGGASQGGGLKMTDKHSLEQRLARLETRNRLLTAGLVGAAAIGLIAAAADRAAPQTFDRIVAREIVVVDGNGRERVVIAAPLPEPRLAGALSKRGDVLSGILLFDGEGNERGGYVTGDDPSSGISLTLDEIGRMAVSLWAGERGSSGLRFGNQDGNSVDFQVNPAGTFLTLRERGQITAVLPASAAPPPPADAPPAPAAPAAPAAEARR
jgi:hypothetical protein